MSDYLADTLITAAREEGVFPASAESSLTARLRRMMNREQRLYLMKVLRSVREEYQEATHSVTLVSGTQSYRLPTRAVAAGIKLVEQQDGDDWTPLEPVKQRVASAFGGDAYGTGDYRIHGNNLVLLRSVSPAGTLRVTYYRRFNELVSVDSTGLITDINTATGVVTISAAPSAFSSSTPFDFIRGTPHFDIMAMDLSATVAGTSLTFDADDLPSDLAEGDYVCLAGESPIVNAPLELQDLLVKRVAFMYLAGQKDPGASIAKQVLDEAEQHVLSLMSPRVEASEPLIINYNAPGWNRFNRSRRFRNG